MSADLPLQLCPYSGRFETMSLAPMPLKNLRPTPCPTVFILCLPLSHACSVGTVLQRLAWECLGPPSRALVASLARDIRTEVCALGSKVLLADAIVLDATLGTTQAAAVLVKLGCWQGANFSSACGRKALSNSMAKATKEVGTVARFEKAGIVAYLKSGLHERREKPPRRCQAKQGTIDFFCDITTAALS